MAIRDLASHHARYVTIAELAEYWGVSRQQIYKRIEAGALEAIQLGSRLVRVPATAALQYEQRARVATGKQRARENDTPLRSDELPKSNGARRINKSDVA